VVESSNSDRNMLFGVVALQLNFVNHQQLIQAMSAWVVEKSKSIGQIMVEQGAIDESDRSMLDNLLDRQISAHAGSVKDSLASVPTVASVREELADIADNDVSASLAHVGRSVPDPFGTRLAEPVQPAPTTPIGPRTSRYAQPMYHAKGGLGIVFRARDTELHRGVALKEIKREYADDEDVRARFVREAVITGKLEHPGVVPVYGLGTYADGRPYYAMRFIRGKTLAAAADEFHTTNGASLEPGKRSLELRRLLGRLIDACNTIAYAHNRGVLHRDLKPANIMLGDYGETLVVDWGLATVIGQDEATDADPSVSIPPQARLSSTQQGAVFGTAGFMAPEQASGHVESLSPQSDIYSLGATLYYLLTGRSSQAGTDLQTALERIRSNQFAPPREVDASLPKSLEAICLKAMAMDPADRYRAADELAVDLERWMADEPVSAREETRLERLSRWGRHHRSWVRAGITALLLVLATLLVATVLINRTRHLTELNAEFDVALLRNSDINEPLFAKLTGLLEEIRDYSEEEFARQRDKLIQDYLEDMERLLDVPRFTTEDRGQLEDRLQLLESQLTEQDAGVHQSLALLRSRADDRLSDWNVVFELRRPFDTSIEDIFDPQQVTPSDSEGLQRLAGGEVPGNLVPVKFTTASNRIQFSLEFGESWTRARVVGFTFRASDSHEYEFLVAVAGFDPRDREPFYLARLPTMGEAIIGERAPQCYALILRDGEPLRRSSLSPGFESLKLDVQFDVGLLRFTVNDETAIEFLDPFPLSPAEGEQWTFGVLWPEDISVVSVRAQEVDVPREPSPLERGDRKFAVRQFAEAREEYRQHQESAEALFKTGLCSLRLNQQDEAIATFNELAGQAADADPKSKPWAMHALLRLAQYHLDQDDLDKFNEVINDLAGYFDLTQVMRWLSEVERDEVLQHFRKSGHRWRIGLDKSKDIEHMKLALKVDMALNEDQQRRRMTKWRLADVYRANGNAKEAVSILSNLLTEEDSRDISVRERCALISDLVWTLRELGRPQQALDLIEVWLSPERNRDNAYLALLIDRARIRYCQGDHQGAKQDLDDFLFDVDKKRVAYADFAGACGLRAWIHEQEDEQEDAKELWEAGTWRKWPGGSPIERDAVALSRGVEMVELDWALAMNGVMISMANDLSNSDADYITDCYVRGSGLLNTAVTNMISAAFPVEFRRDLMLQIWQSEQGRKMLPDLLLRRMSLTDLVIRPGSLIFYQGVLLGAFADQTISKELDETIFFHCRGILEDYDERRIKEDHMITVMELWRGRTVLSRWEELAAVLPPARTGGLAFVFSRRFRQFDKPNTANRFLQEALDNEATPEPVRREAERDARKFLNESQGEQDQDQ
jgi:serine/threonine protein kinase/tetratricopeptide (TPR) repeat protein